MQILILNGPNLNLIGRRQPEIYGRRSFQELLPEWEADFPHMELSLRQSNHEGDLVDWIQEWPVFDGIVINAGAYSHTSIALYDALVAAHLPKVEVHITNVYAREKFRHESLIAPVCDGTIAGLGTDGYRLALHWLQTNFKEEA
jgi:3-dehydroquinate dehydratase-2